ncbi:MAG: tyrosine-type recombinase/integrase [Ktedonobacteraceae bacterium]
MDKTQTHLMTGETLQAARCYIEEARPGGPSLFEGFTPGQPLTTRAINKRVGELGRLVGIERLSPHDLRHTWATRATRHGTPLERLRQAGGWAGLSMPLRYIEESAIANEGVILYLSIPRF